MEEWLNGKLERWKRKKEKKSPEGGIFMTTGVARCCCDIYNV